MKQITIFLMLPFFVLACGNNNSSEAEDAPQTPPQSMVPDEPADEGKGIGEIKNVELNNPLKPDMVESGKAIYELKCSACHKLTDQRVVGPGWKGITERRKPEWNMNMMVNVDVMLAEDPTAQKLLEECLVRMPNQNLTREHAREVLEFMYANDGHEIAAN